MPALFTFNIIMHVSKYNLRNTLTLRGTNFTNIVLTTSLFLTFSFMYLKYRF